MSVRRTAAIATLGVLAAMTTATAGASPARSSAGSSPAVCAPGGPPVEFTGSADGPDAKTYRVLPFEVAAGTTRVEVGYSWSDVSPLPSTPLTPSVIDLGLWDADGYRRADGFRGWSGSRQGKTSKGQEPVFVQRDVADRGYSPGPIERGVWWVELGIAAVAPGGLTYAATVSCSSPATGGAFESDRVDPDFVADPTPGWYAGDFHMHGYHSASSAPPFDDGDPTDVDSFVDFARDAGLDFFPITEYVTAQHHDELGPVQRANPDVVIWPSREIITYFGHATVFGETPGVVDYRHGFEDVTLGDIQERSVAAGALFGVAHPTSFPEPVFTSFCRGCEFNLGDEIDWSLVDTIEVLTGPILVDDSEAGGPGGPIQIQNPFVETAIDLWEERLLAGDRITAVSGSDDKAGPDLGSSATQVFATALSRPALIEAVQAGRAYVQTRGVADSPTLEMTAADRHGRVALMGETVWADQATIDVTVSGADGQFLRISRDGDVVDLVPVDGDVFRHRIDATSTDGSGPLGTFWRVDTLDQQSLTTISNPIFLRPSPDDGVPAPNSPDSPTTGADVAPESDQPSRLPATGDRQRMPWSVVLAGAALAIVTVVRRTRGPIADPPNSGNYRCQNGGHGDT